MNNNAGFANHRNGFNGHAYDGIVHKSELVLEVIREGVCMNAAKIENMGQSLFPLLQNIDRRLQSIDERAQRIEANGLDTNKLVAELKNALDKNSHGEVKHGKFYYPFTTIYLVI